MQKTLSIGAEVTSDADCSRGKFQALEVHDRQQSTAVYVRSLAVRMTTTGDGGSWNRNGMMQFLSNIMMIVMMITEITTFTMYIEVFILSGGTLDECGTMPSG